MDVAEIATFIPDSFALGVDECLARCGISRGEQPVMQQQPRVSANAFASGVVASASAVVASVTASASAAGASGASVASAATA